VASEPASNGYGPTYTDIEVTYPPNGLRDLARLHFGAEYIVIQTDHDEYYEEYAWRIVRDENGRRVLVIDIR